MKHPTLNLYIAVISHARAQNVKRMHDTLGCEATWYVGEGDAQAYRDAGAKRVVESGPLCKSRNAALRDAWARGLYSVQFSDDLKDVGLVTCQLNGKNIKKPVSVATALGIMKREADASTARLIGVPCTANHLWCRADKPKNEAAFIIGDLIMVKPCDLFFDEQMRLKEDYDYTLQHVRAFGKVLRLEHLLPAFTHRTNKGGAVAIRTNAKELEAIAHLKRKWGPAIQPHHTKPTEIRLVVKNLQAGPTGAEG